MSDLVRYPVGNTADRDFLNWPTILRSEIDDVIGVLTEPERDAIWPIDVNRDKAMALAWRVKKWTLSGNCSCAIEYDEPGQHISATGTSVLRDVDIFSLVDGETGEVAAETESELLDHQFDDNYRALVNNGIGALPDTLLFDWEIIGSDDFGGGPVPFMQSGTTDNSDTSFRIFSEFVLYDPDTKLFAPKFLGLQHVIPQVPFGRLFMDAKFLRTPVDDTAGTTPFLQKAQGSFTLVSDLFVDIEVPMQLSWRLTDESVGATVTGSASGSFQLLATEYWPYKNKSGAAVYSSGDGSQLVNPFS